MDRDVWGGGMSWVQDRTGQASPSRAFGGSPIESASAPGETLAFEDVLGVAAATGAPGPWEIRPPRGENGTFYVASTVEDRSARVELHVDRFDGTVVHRTAMEDYPPLAAAVSLGIAFHRGELYGWVNTAQNALAAALGLTLSVSGFVAWWLRRPVGSLGVPAVPTARAGAGLPVPVAALALALVPPLMGASLVLVLLLDRFVFRRLGWFGTEPATAEAAPGAA